MSVSCPSTHGLSNVRQVDLTTLSGMIGDRVWGFVYKNPIIKKLDVKGPLEKSHKNWKCI